MVVLLGILIGGALLLVIPFMFGDYGKFLRKRAHSPRPADPLADKEKQITKLQKQLNSLTSQLEQSSSELEKANAVLETAKKKEVELNDKLERQKKWVDNVQSTLEKNKDQSSTLSLGYAVYPFQQQDALRARVL